MSKKATVHLLEGTVPEGLPPTLPESGNVLVLRDLLQALYQQLDRKNSEPLNPDLAGMLCKGLVAWTEGHTLEQGMGLESEGGHDTRRQFWMGLRNRHLATCFRLLDVPRTLSFTARARALVQALESFEAGRYRVWKAGPGQPPPEAGERYQVAYAALNCAERCGGWPKDPQRLLEAIEKGSVLLLDESE